MVDIRVSDSVVGSSFLSDPSKITLELFNATTGEKTLGYSDSQNYSNGVLSIDPVALIDGYSYSDFKIVIRNDDGKVTNDTFVKFNVSSVDKASAKAVQNKLKAEETADAKAKILAEAEAAQSDANKSQAASLMSEKTPMKFEISETTTGANVAALEVTHTGNKDIMNKII